MSGHNKWSKIKYTKAKEDAAKGKIFARYSHEITLAAQSGGDPDMNPRLRAAIDGAKSVSMPKDNIDRAIKKGTGELGGNHVSEVTYEAYGPSGTAFMIEVVTDNLNRSASELRSMLTKHGGSMATPGSVAFQFERKGQVSITEPGLDPDKAMDLALESGADDVEEGDSENEWVFTTDPAELNNVATALREAKHPVTSMRLVSIATNVTEIADVDTAKTAMRLFDLLDDYDDCVNVFTNFDVAADIVDSLGD